MTTNNESSSQAALSTYNCIKQTLESIAELHTTKDPILVPLSNPQHHSLYSAMYDEVADLIASHPVQKLNEEAMTADKEAAHQLLLRIFQFLTNCQSNTTRERIFPTNSNLWNRRIR